MLRLVGSDTEMKVINLDEKVGKETLKLRFCSLRLVSIPLTSFLIPFLRDIPKGMILTGEAQLGCIFLSSTGLSGK